MANSVHNNNNNDSANEITTKNQYWLIKQTNESCNNSELNLTELPCPAASMPRQCFTLGCSQFTAGGWLDEVVNLMGVTLLDMRHVRLNQANCNGSVHKQHKSQPVSRSFSRRNCTAENNIIDSRRHDSFHQQSDQTNQLCCHYELKAPVASWMNAEG